MSGSISMLTTLPAPTRSPRNAGDPAMRYAQCMRDNGVAEFPDPVDGRDSGLRIRQNEPGTPHDTYPTGPPGNPSGSAYPTVGDLTRFVQVLLGHQPLSPAMTDTVLTGKVDTGRPGPAFSSMAMASRTRRGTKCASSATAGCSRYRSATADVPRPRLNRRHAGQPGPCRQTRLRPDQLDPDLGQLVRCPCRRELQRRLVAPSRTSCLDCHRLIG